MRATSFLALTFLLIASTFGAEANPPEGTTVHVATDGDDQNPGTADRPLATLAAARDRVRAERAGCDGPITVVVRGGTYYLPETLSFTPEDSGSATAPIVYRAADGETPVLSGGVKLELNWQPHQDGVWMAETPAGLDIDQVFVNGERQHMARYPDFDPDVRPYDGFAADAFSPQRAARWSAPAGGYIHAMHRAHWGGYHYRITGKQPDNTVTYEGGWQNNRQMGMHPEHRYVENIREELDAPGEWFHDAQTGTLYFYPPDAKHVDRSLRDRNSRHGVTRLLSSRLNGATVEVVRLRHLFEFNGSQEHPVRFVTLCGFTFRHAARTFMDTREPLLRSDWTIYRGGAVVFNGAEDCGVTDCEFDQVGGNTIFVNNYNRRVLVRGCYIHDGGGNGVALVGDPKAVRNPLFEYGQRQDYASIDKTPGPQSDNYPADCTVEDCLITRIGRVEKQAAGVQISMAQGISVRHCSIYEVPRAGVNISEGTFGGHVIEFCDVFDTVLETGDHGSFNSWGRDRFWG
nr:right-handed parallel beta-helix repeat-containing protein [Pirellulaceae bacterium]